MQNIFMKKDKSIFISLLVLIILFIFISIILLTLFINTSDLELYKLIAKAIIVIIVLICMYLVYITIQLIKIIKNNTPSILSIKIVSKSFNILYPIMMLLSNIFKIDKDPIRRVFSQINNKIVELNGIAIKPNEILILAPHCLQNSRCKYKITGNIYNCKRCGGCNVHDLILLNEKYSTNLEIVTGGTLARKIINDYFPKGIIAIACERDLTSGILDVKFTPVIGVTNKRPEGPCHNTCVDIKEVEKAIKVFLTEVNDEQS